MSSGSKEENELSRLIIENQKLHSWSSFYLNSTTEIQVSRYPLMSKLITNRVTGDAERKTIIPYLSFSKRYQEDKTKAFRLGLKIKENQLLINKIKKELGIE